MLSESHLECPLGLPDVDLMAFFTWNLVDHSSLPLLRNAGLESHQGLSDASKHSANNSFQLTIYNHCPGLFLVVTYSMHLQYVSFHYNSIRTRP